MNPSSLMLLAQADPPAEGLAWWAYLIWGWLAVSLAVYAYRLWRRIVGKHRPAEPSKTGPQASPATTGPSPTEALFLEAKAARQGKPLPESGGAASPDPSLETARSSESPAPPVDDRRGLFASGDGSTPENPPVPELLTGIALPCDLVPITDEASTDPTLHRVAFHTAGFDPAEVGRRLGDELERLGFALRSTSDTEVVARRGSHQLLVTLFARAGDATRDDQPAYPSIPPADVVVQITS